MAIAEEEGTLLECAVRYANQFKPRERLGKAEKWLTEHAKPGEWDSYGIEYITTCSRNLAYLNTGDTYSLTIGQEGDGEVFVTSWGGWVEEVECEHCEENDKICCGYCGEFTTVDSEEWSNTVCEFCGRYVDGGILSGDDD